MEKALLRLVDYEADQDLRQVNWNRGFLEREVSQRGLGFGQAVVYRNTAEDRYRIVANIGGVAVLILPPVDKHARLSVDLMVSEYLRAFNAAQGVVKRLDANIETAKARLARRKQLARNAQKGRQRGKKEKRKRKARGE